MAPLLALVYTYIHPVISFLWCIAGSLCSILIAGVLHAYLIFPGVAEAFPEVVSFCFEVVVGLTCALVCVIAGLISLDTYFKFVFLFVFAHAIGSFTIRGREFNVCGIRIRCV